MPQLSVIVPTFNELGNIVELRNRVAEALTGIDWEMIFVDDNSPDGTAQAVREMAQADRRVRCIQRIGRRGLSTACIEGMLASSAPVVAVIDADLQHDERLLPKMFELIQGGDLDVVVGSRYVESGGIGNWDSSRAAFSRWATQLSRVVLKADLKDPMSGFFMIRHEAALACIKAGMSGVGFKILLDLFATSPTPLRHRELPYEFRNRVAGESKLDTNVAWEYFIMLLDKFTGGVVPIRFIAFSLVGGLGLVVHLIVLAGMFKGLGTSFLWAQSGATLVAMTSNYVMNNVLTYRDMRLRGWSFVRGWLSFVVACSVGALANVGIADYLFHKDSFWITSAIAGVLVGAVWNYAVTAVYTWKTPKAG
ncbi:MAG: glycosyltransferase family 2 protein [Comamonadaceae bacterium]|jgi:dolichol-phosphate mannosyltransferase|nr:glycosyltransferase family 2 protein [Comamonadaceae bacterium]